jgi:UDP-glucose 4-epimerase
MSRILIVGSTGFIGSAIVKRLSGQYSLFCPTTNEIDVAKDVLPLYREINNQEIDVILDLAHPRLRNSLQSLAKSVTMIRNILEASRVGDTSLVFLSSLQVFDGYCEGTNQPLKSEFRLKPATIYGQSKALCEEYIGFYRDLYGLKVTVLRPPLVYGRGMDKHTFVWKFITNAAANKPITVHRYLNGFQRFDFLHVDDLIDGGERAIRLRPSEDINLGTGFGMSTLNIAELVTKLTKSKSEINIVDIKDRAADLVADINRAKEILKWEPKTDFQTALHDLLPA